MTDTNPAHNLADSVVFKPTSGALHYLCGFTRTMPKVDSEGRIKISFLLFAVLIRHETENSMPFHYIADGEFRVVSK